MLGRKVCRRSGAKRAQAEQGHVSDRCKRARKKDVAEEAGGRWQRHLVFKAFRPLWKHARTACGADEREGKCRQEL